jgi:arginine repressor
MAKTKSKKSGGMNKSAEIRKVAAAMKSKGVKPRPSVIVAELKAKGVAVAPAQVSTILKKMGFRPLRKRKKRGAPTAAGASAKALSKGAPKSSSISIDDLIAAKKMAGSLGGTEKALAALSALKRFEE